MQAAIDLLLRSLPILIGGGLVQLIIFLLKRRVELRAIDATAVRTEAEANSVVVLSAAQSLVLSDQVRDDAVRRAKDAVERAEALQTELTSQIEQLQLCTRRLAAVAQELSVLRAQVAAMRGDSPITP
jgi:hypothetical protein